MTRAPFTPAELSRRRRDLLRPWRLGWAGALDFMAARLESELAERGCEPVGNAARSFRSAAGVTLHLVQGGKRSPRIAPFRPRGGRAA